MSTKTTRMSIDIPIKDHKRIKILASAEGVSIKDFVLRQLEPILYKEKSPNATTKKAFKATDQKKSRVKCKDIDDLLEKLGVNE